MSVLAGCQDARNMKEITEVDCPKCHEEGVIEVFLKDGSTVGESVCSACGYVMPEGRPLETILEE